MAHPNSYPSPTQAQMADGSHPFYSAQHQPPLAEPIDINSAAQRPGPPPPTGQSHEPDIYSSRDAQHQNQYHEAPHSPTAQLMQAAHPMAPSHDPNLAMPSAKRTKTSRACDQCRSKKTRCDEIPGSQGVQCVGCKRNNQTCEFSREPQKRGPSKGYIKELAERVGALEKGEKGQHSPEIPYANMTPVPQQQQQQGIPAGYMGSPVDVPYGERKRTHSSTERLQPSPFLQDQSFQMRPPDSTHSYGSMVSRQSNPFGATSQHRTSISNIEKTAVGMDDSQIREALMHPGSDDIDGQVTLYYDIIHPVFPFLPHERSRLFSNLANVSSTVRQAFYAALDTFAHPGKYDPVPRKHDENSSMQPANLIVDLQYADSTTQTTAEKLVILQIILLMILATEMTGSLNIEYRGWYVQAFGAATFYFGRLRRVRETSKMLGSDPDEHHVLARRAWLTLVTLEHWHAAGTAAATLCPDELTTLVADDHEMFGDVGYFLLRSSFVLGHVVDTRLWDSSNASADGMVWRMLNAEKDRMRESLEDHVVATPNDYLGLHLDLFIQSQGPPDFPHLFSFAKAVDNALSLASMLQNAKSGRPLNMTHHHAALASMVLVEALKKSDRKDEALVALQHFHQVLSSGEMVMSVGDRWATPLKNFLASSIQQHLSSGPGTNGATSGPDRAGLQHLADAAVGETETAGGNVGNSGSRRGSSTHSAVASKGYLSLLSKYA